MEQPESSYIGHHSELYDLFYAGKPYEEEARFVHECIQQYCPPNARLLELACGTGTHSIFLEKYGYQIIATDYSSDMLARAQEKAKKNNSQVEFRQQDMRDLNVPEGPFDSIICLFDSIGYVGSNENINLVLNNVHRHLKPGGVFIFEFWHAGAMLKSYDPLRIRRWQTPNGEILRISETKIDYSRQSCQVDYSIYELNNDGSYVCTRESQVNRFFLVQEMELHLKSAQLIPLKWFSGFHKNEVINEETWHIVCLASRSHQ
jgi:SAM-dependent methyltransferase